MCRICNKLFLILVLLFCYNSVWSKNAAKPEYFQPDHDKKNTMKNELFDFIISLGEQNAFTQKKLSKLTNIPLKKSPEKSTAYFSVYYSPDDCTAYHPNIRKIELRSPVAKEDSGGLIIMDLVNTLDITGRDIVARFGDVDNLGVPYPEQPPDDPIFYEYQFEWGALKFGISRSEPEHLINVVLDAYEKPFLFHKKAAEG